MGVVGGGGQQAGEGSEEGEDGAQAVGPVAAVVAQEQPASDCVRGGACVLGAEVVPKKAKMVPRQQAQ